MTARTHEPFASLSATPEFFVSGVAIIALVVIALTLPRDVASAQPSRDELTLEDVLGFSGDSSPQEVREALLKILNDPDEDFVDFWWTLSDLDAHPQNHAARRDADARVEAPSPQEARIEAEALLKSADHDDLIDLRDEFVAAIDEPFLRWLSSLSELARPADPEPSEPNR